MKTQQRDGESGTPQVSGSGRRLGRVGGWEREDPREPKHSSFYPQPPALKHRGGGHQRTRVHSLPIMTMSWYSSPRDPSPSLAILIKHSPKAPQSWSCSYARATHPSLSTSWCSLLRHGGFCLCARCGSRAGRYAKVSVKPAPLLKEWRKEHSFGGVWL